ncbi:MAG TPA: hypothetical protein VNJ12_10980, partial [Candidatus Dormibacteraeota bacterium]|nr:hypothetical protein [Candidatus Dormibacteraeota bacterium]
MGGVVGKMVGVEGPGESHDREKDGAKDRDYQRVFDHCASPLVSERRGRSRERVGSHELALRARSRITAAKTEFEFFFGANVSAHFFLP